MAKRITAEEISGYSPSLILDIGCGRALEPGTIGIDIDADAIRGISGAFLGRGENLPFADKTFREIRSRVAFPYMDIPKALAEAFRVARPGAQVHIKFHPYTFAIEELRRATQWKDFIFRLFVLFNGLLFHFTGRAIRLPNGRIDTFQTESRLRKEFQRAGFGDVRFGWDIRIVGQHAGNCWITGKRFHGMLIFSGAERMRRELQCYRFPNRNH